MYDSDSRKLVFSKYGQIIEALDQMEKDTYSNWIQNLDEKYIKRLEKPLMVRCKDNTSMLAINFDKWVTQT